MLGMIEGRRRQGQQSMRCLDGITYSRDMSLSKLLKMVKDREAWLAAVHVVAKSPTELSDRTITTADSVDTHSQKGGCIHTHTAVRVSWGHLSSLKSTLDHHLL